MAGPRRRQARHDADPIEEQVHAEARERGPREEAPDTARGPPGASDFHAGPLTLITPGESARSEADAPGISLHGARRDRALRRVLLGRDGHVGRDATRDEDDPDACPEPPLL